MVALQVTLYITSIFLPLPPCSCHMQRLGLLPIGRLLEFVRTHGILLRLDFCASVTPPVQADPLHQPFMMMMLFLLLLPLLSSLTLS
ncbi:hypothetical protein C8Q76DRAFT_64215 [Earliella scabrosa]|nr:hypothetical protein C8Q76DRAFT_64215 [Earliella scabrosa]